MTKTLEELDQEYRLACCQLGNLQYISEKEISRLKGVIAALCIQGEKVKEAEAKTPTPSPIPS